jgi:GNAT superfamily N-acetyltransferase
VIAWRERYQKRGLAALTDRDRPGRPRGLAVAAMWEQVMTWPSMIRLRADLPLATAPCGEATGPMPGAGQVIARLGLWQRPLLAEAASSPLALDCANRQGIITSRRRLRAASVKSRPRAPPLARRHCRHEGDPRVITLTDAAPDDAAAIASLLAELDTIYGDAPQGTQGERAAQVRAALFADPPAARALLAWDGPALAGLASWSLLWPAAGLTMSLYLKELYVAQAYRRAGAGKLLMEGLRRIAADRGCSRVEWTTDATNTAAQQFYESLGVKALPTKIFYRAPTGAA